MPAVRRLRLLVLATVFVLTSLYYLTNRRYTWNYGYSPYIGNSPSPSAQIHWKPHADYYPVTSFIPLPTGKPISIPEVQATVPKEDAKQKEEREKRKDAVKKSFLHSWSGYKKHAWLRDEVAPISGQYRDTFGGWAATLVDSLDTLWIMGEKKDFELAVKAAETIDFTFTESDSINVFETTIRYLGGFLAAYDISDKQYPALLKKATEVGDLLMSCFDTPNRMPITRWDWVSYAKGRHQEAPRRMLVSELGSLTLEFTRLSQLTSNSKYYDAVQRISNEFEKSQNSTMLPGMWPVTVDAETPSFSFDTYFTLGGMSDSLYEYFPKQFLLLGGLLTQPKTLYEKFLPTAKSKLFFRIYNPKDEALTVSGDVRVREGESTLNPRGQHLTCFTGGMVALASKIFARPDDLALASELAAGCVWAYDSSINGIAPEIYSVMPCPEKGDCKWTDRTWHDRIGEIYSKGPATETDAQIASRVQKVIKDHSLPPGFTSIEDRRYILRPEAIESVFILYRITGEQKWADAAWRMFQAIEKVSKTDIAAAAISDITEENPVKMDSMESFWLAETLKYFYLVFADWDVVSLDDWVLNTEAHPLRRPK